MSHSHPRQHIGVDPLLSHCVTDAFYDSAAREFNCSCFPGTRIQHIKDITTCIIDKSLDSQYHLIWVYGPAGVGKTTIAQSCAEETTKYGVLGASFFFSRDTGVLEPTNLITTIAYQLARQISQYEDILKERLHKNPAILIQDIETQFQQLIVDPFLEIQGDLPLKAIFVDGLDECADTGVQSKVVELIAMHGNKLPLFWAFFSRPTPQINATFSKDSVSSHCRKIELPISQDLDADIKIYLRGTLQISRQSRDIEPSFETPIWPSDQDLNTLVRRPAGDFSYAVSIAKLIMGPDSPGPTFRLREALFLDSLHQGLLSRAKDLDEVFYTIMSRIPAKLLSGFQRVLFLLHHESLSATIPNKHAGPILRILTNLSELSSGELEDMISILRSVLAYKSADTEVVQETWGSTSVFFTDASFMEFLINKERSQEFWLEAKCHLKSLALRGLVLVDGMDRVNGISGDQKMAELRKLFSALPNEIYTNSQLLKIRDELYQYLQNSLQDWCTLSGVPYLTSGPRDKPGRTNDLPGLSRALLWNILRDERKAAALIGIRGAIAQCIVDFLSKVLDDEDALDDQGRETVFSFLIKLVRLARVSPACVNLEEIECDFTRPLHEKGYISVYKGKYQGTNIHVNAVRIRRAQNTDVDFEDDQSQKRELGLWAFPSHQNVLPIYGLFQFDGALQGFYVISMVVNVDLSQYLEAHPTTSRTIFVVDIIAGLRYLHRVGLIHGDLKAKNILICDNGRALITSGSGLSRAAMTTPAILTVRGSINWMAPELINSNNRLFTRESDVWAFGCVCFEIFTGKMPFYQYRFYTQLISAFTTGPVTPLTVKITTEDEELPIIDDKMQSLMEKCWERDPTNRPTCESLQSNLADFIGSATHSQNNVATDLQLFKKIRRRSKVDYESVVAILFRVQQGIDFGE